MRIITQRQLNRALKDASTYQEWQDAARAYDRHHKLDLWRGKDHTGQYDYVSIRGRLDSLRSLKARHDIRGLLFTLNEGIHGNMGGMGRAGLYAKAKAGTKRLVEDYIDEIVHVLGLLAEDKSGDLSQVEKIEFFRRASHCFGHSALMLSGSGSLLYFHVGVAKALVEAGVLPAVLSGSSGGAIVGSLICTHSEAELIEILTPEFLFDNLSPAASKGRVADVGEIEETISRFLPDLTFEQAFKKTGRAMNVSVAPAETHQTSRLLNATTSPSVLIRSAVMASAAVPGIFPAVTLQAIDDHGNRKNYLPSRKWVDGSVSDDLPAKRLARLYGVNHYIVSQTNPHVLPFVTDGQRKKTAFGLVENAARRSAREWFNAVTLIVDRADRKNGRVTQLTSMARSIINQDYVGDINILPDYKFTNPRSLLSFPGEKQVKRLIDSGEKCTWPKLEMIRQQTKISRKLAEILRSLDAETI